ncbi:MAG: hypothetical protein JSV90_05020 [Methanobacteriota archaeon]|nr:MAG: hypothetical protein JSV90_05020 [Euryarchaeota archaeon]
MGLFAEIKEIATVEGTPLTYVYIEIWRTKADHDAGAPPVGNNDFHMQLQAEGERVHKNAAGQVVDLASGSTYPPDRVPEGVELVKETFQVDVPQVIKENIEAYLTRRIRRDRTRRPLPEKHANREGTNRSQDDPAGVLHRGDVQALVGVGVEVRGR